MLRLLHQIDNGKSVAQGLPRGLGQLKFDCQFNFYRVQKNNLENNLVIWETQRYDEKLAFRRRRSERCCTKPIEADLALTLGI